MEGRDDDEFDLSDDERRRPPAADRQRRARPTSAASRPSSTSPSRRRATPRRRWSSAWRSSASAGPRPTPRSSRRSRSANTSARRRTGSSPRTRAASSPPSSPTTSAATSTTTSPPTSRSDLDRVTTGEEDWKALLARFWARFLRRARRDRGPAHHRGARQDQRGAGAAPLPEDRPRTPSRAAARSAAPGCLSLKTSRNGSAFIGCSNYPECRYTRPLAGGDEGDAGARRQGARHRHPRRRGLRGGGRRRQPVTLHKGPYGYYVQLGEAVEGAEAAARLDPEGHGPGDARRSSGRSSSCRCRGWSAAIPRTASRSRPASAASARS